MKSKLFEGRDIPFSAFHSQHPAQVLTLSNVLIYSSNSSVYVLNVEGGITSCLNTQRRPHESRNRLTGPFYWKVILLLFLVFYLLCYSFLSFCCSFFFFLFWMSFFDKPWALQKTFTNRSPHSLFNFILFSWSKFSVVLYSTVWPQEGSIFPKVQGKKCELKETKADFMWYFDAP